jgi:hypothetical protein
MTFLLTGDEFVVVVGVVLEVGVVVVVVKIFVSFEYNVINCDGVFYV